MFLFDDRLGDREAETGSFPNRFSGEKRRIEFLFDLFRDSQTIVFDNQPYPVAIFYQPDLDGRTIRVFDDTFGFAEDSITGVVHQVENRTTEVLRYHFDRRKRVVVFFYDGNIETLVIGTDSMVGKPYIFFCQLAEVGRYIFIVFAAGIEQDTSDDARCPVPGFPQSYTCCF